MPKSSEQTTETDEEIESRVRRELFDVEPTRLRIPGPFEIVALLRLLDKARWG